MKRKDLKGTWQEAVERFENCWAPDILGWWYSRHCLGEKLDMEMVLRDAKEECPLISAIVGWLLMSVYVWVSLPERKTVRLGRWGHIARRHWVCDLL